MCQGCSRFFVLFDKVEYFQFTNARLRLYFMTTPNVTMSTEKPDLYLKPIEGLIVATLNPHSLNETGGTVLDFACVEQYADYLSSNGARGVFVCGTTGDFSVLSVGERLRIQEAWLTPSVKDKFEHVIVHIGSPVWEDLVALGTHATERGASAVAVTFPSFPHHSPQTPQHMLQYFVRVSHALPNTPLMLYNIQGATPPQCFTKFCDFLKILTESEEVPNLRAVKYTSANFIDAFEIQNSFDNIQVCFGCDEMIFPVQVAGLKSFIGSTYNIFGRSCTAMCKLVKESKIDEARKIYQQVFEAIRLLTSEGFFMLNLRVTTNKLVQYRKKQFSLGNITKFNFTTSEDVNIAEKLSDRVLKNYMDILNL